MRKVNTSLFRIIVTHVYIYGRRYRSDEPAIFILQTWIIQLVQSIRYPSLFHSGFNFPFFLVFQFAHKNVTRATERYECMYAVSISTG